MTKNLAEETYEWMKFIVRWMLWDVTSWWRFRLGRDPPSDIYLISDFPAENAPSLKLESISEDYNIFLPNYPLSHSTVFFFFYCFHGNGREKVRHMVWAIVYKGAWKALLFPDLIFLKMEVGMKARYSIFVIFGDIQFKSVISGSQDKSFCFLLHLKRT